jgi:hypothetical protein
MRNARAAQFIQLAFERFCIGGKITSAGRTALIEKTWRDNR